MKPNCQAHDIEPEDLSFLLCVVLIGIVVVASPFLLYYKVKEGVNWVDNWCVRNPRTGNTIILTTTAVVFFLIMRFAIDLM